MRSVVAGAPRAYFTAVIREASQSLAHAVPRALRLRPAALMVPGVLLVYVAIAFGIFASAWRDPFHRNLGFAGDPSQFMWFLAWVPYAITHGLNPFFSNFADYPAGANLLWNTSIPLVALIFWPVTVALGPVAAYNLVVTLALPLTAWCGFLLLRRYVGSPLAAGLGGLLYGFSPYMLGQSLAHPQMTMAFLPPLILLLLDEIVRAQRRRPALLGSALAVAGAAQLLISEEVLVATGLAAFVLLVTAAALWPGAVLPRARYAAKAFAVAGVLFLALAAWPVGFQLFGPQHVTGSPHEPNVYVSDLLGFWVPTQIEWLAPAPALRVSAHFIGNLSEWDAYLGIPFTLLLAFTAVRHWRSGWVRLAVLAGSVLAILSLGVTLHVGGTVKAWLPAFTLGLAFLILPGEVPARALVLLTFGAWLALWRLPLLSSVIPDRLTLLVYLMAGMVLAVFVDWLLGLDRRRLTVGAVALVLALLPLVPRLPYLTTTIQDPAFFTSRGQASRMPEGSVALIAPVVTFSNVEAMRWQATSGMRFRMPEGYLFVPAPPPAGSRLLAPPSVTTNALIEARDGRTTAVGDARVRQSIRAELAAWNVRTVVLGPMVNQDAAVALLTWALGRPPEAVGGVYVWWDVDASLTSLRQ